MGALRGKNSVMRPGELAFLTDRGKAKEYKKEIDGYNEAAGKGLSGIRIGQYQKTVADLFRQYFSGLYR